MIRLARLLARIAACALLIAGVARPAAAQVFIGRDVPHTGSWEASGGVLWTQGFDQGVATAQLTRNPSTGSGPLDLFTSDLRVGSATGAQAHLAFYLSRALAVEGGFQYSRPVLSTRLSDDFEEADDATADEVLARYVFDGSVVFHFGAFAGGKGVPFVLAGGGYVRELHDGSGVVETGNEFHGGAGLKYWFSTGRRRLGLRAEVGATMRSGGADSGDSRRTLPTAGLSLAYLF